MLPIHTILLAGMIALFIVALAFAFVRDKSKDATTLFFAGYALAAILLVLGH